jgi:putative tricarboxylic transport membrane protein
MGTLLAEVIILALVGIMSIVDGIRLVFAQKLQLYDVLGPGFYNIGMGSILIIVGVIYFISQRGRIFIGKKEALPSKEYKIKRASMVGVLALYIFLLDYIGYFFSSMVFFVLLNKIVGFRAWMSNLAVSIAMTLIFYIVFVKWLDMIFPQGILLRPS